MQLQTPLSKDEQAVVTRFAVSREPASLAMRKLLEGYIAQVIDVRNIDPKSNMGLQALANQVATKVLMEVFSEFNLEIPETDERGKKKISQWQ